MEFQMKYGIIIFLSICCLQVNAKDIEAITTDGKSVLLHENGKWEFNKKVEKTSDFSFRKTNWGMSKSQVKGTEAGKILRDDDVLAYEGNVAGLNTLIAYIFVDNKLVRAKYIFTEKHSNKTDYISDYTSIQKILTKKYGEPSDDKTYWKNDLYKDDYQYWGMALAVGHLSKFSNWKVSDTEVWLSINGDNYEISHSVEYSSVKLASLESTKSEEKAAEQF
jgi:hypothetical protein